MKKNTAPKTIRDTGNGIKVTERNKIKGTGYPLHWHDYFEIQIITNGHGMHIHNSERTEYKRGSAWILSYCDCHGFEYEVNTSAVSIAFDESVLSPELAKLVSVGINKYNCAFTNDELKEVLATVNRLKSEIISANPLNDAMAAALLTDIIIRIIRISDKNSAETIPSHVQKMVSYVYKNFRGRVSLKNIENELSVSAQYLGEQFKKTMGMPFNTYLNAVRIRYCCNLLLSTDMSIKEAAYSGGYSSVEYFLQVFKKTMGITPTEYRKREGKALRGVKI